MVKVQRRISRGRYFIAAFITLLVFLLGVSLGLIVDYERMKYVDQENELQKVNYDSLQLQYLYMGYIPDNHESCGILKLALEDSISQLSESLEAVERYQEDSIINKNEYAVIERKHLIDNLRYWMFSKRLQQVCQEDTINILYFFSLEDCDVCPNQGTILSYFKKKLDDKLLVFPINLDLKEDERFLKILKLQYNITTLPTLIINEEKYEGIISKPELAEIICNQTENKEQCLI